MGGGFDIFTVLLVLFGDGGISIVYDLYCDDGLLWLMMLLLPLPRVVSKAASEGEGQREKERRNKTKR